MSNITKHQMEQRSILARSLETEVQHCIACCICGDDDSIYDLSSEAFAVKLFDMGWRYEVSDKFGIEGPMCPSCFTTQDCERNM